MFGLAGFFLVATLRIAIIYFLISAVVAATTDVRFAGLGVAVRNLVLDGILIFLIPLAYQRKKNRASYPVFFDFIYLSIFGLDQTGSFFNLYNSIPRFDLVAHFHGTAAVTALFALFFIVRKWPRLNWFEISLMAIGAATIIHVILEGQEYYTDILGGTRNVRGIGDAVNDLVAGLAGSVVYVGILVLALKNMAQAARQAFLKPLSIFA